MNIFTNTASALPDEIMETLLQTRGVRIERIVSHGQISPEGFWYDQPQGEWILLLQGAARLQWETGSLELRPGDYVNIPPRRKHRVEWTAPDMDTIWLAVFYDDPEIV